MGWEDLLVLYWFPIGHRKSIRGRQREPILRELATPGISITYIRAYTNN